MIFGGLYGDKTAHVLFHWPTFQVQMALSIMHDINDEPMNLRHTQGL